MPSGCCTASSKPITTKNMADPGGVRDPEQAHRTAFERGDAIRRARQQYFVHMNPSLTAEAKLFRPFGDSTILFQQGILCVAYPLVILDPTALRVDVDRDAERRRCQHREEHRRRQEQQIGRNCRGQWQRRSRILRN